MNYKHILLELINHELEDYPSYTYKVLDDEFCEIGEFEHYYVSVLDNGELQKHLEFKIKGGGVRPITSIELYEGCWEEIEYFEPSIKYFWMALLKLHG